jgi:hypothetical protein
MGIHTSHGSQIVTGMSMLYAESALYAYNNGTSSLDLEESGDDLGHTGDTTWVPITRNALNGDPDLNMVIWSWCGGCSDNTEEGINIYLNTMNDLEQDYPNVKFIYMTGHLDGTGLTGTLYASNNQIRNYCNANNKILFDFADVESYDPDGNYYPDESDACQWCSNWCSAHDCPNCGDCAHSHCFNCYQKGKAFWWMMARIAGWDGVLDINDSRPLVLPEKIHLYQNSPNPFNPSTNIIFSIETSTFVKLEIFNLIGQNITTLVNQALKAGSHEVAWDGVNSDNNQMPSGIYFYRLTVGEASAIRKMVLLR